jgi:hypothetical protein
MNSIFNESDVASDDAIQTELATDQQAFLTKRTLVRSDKLGVKQGNAAPIQGQFNLYSDCLVLSQANPIATSLLYKRIEPFCESEESGESKYGFSLMGSLKQEDFYVASEEALNLWLSDL